MIGSLLLPLHMAISLVITSTFMVHFQEALVNTYNDKFITLCMYVYRLCQFTGVHVLDAFT